MLKIWFSIDNYKQMLSKSGNYLFLDVYLGTLILRKSIISIEETFIGYETLLSVEEIDSFLVAINGFGLIVGFVIMGLGHILQFHNRLSDLIGIRKYFDLYFILLPMSSLSGSEVSIFTLEKLKVNRHAIMRQVFYKYCSDSAEDSPVDKHLIQNALTAWSWFWVLLEGIAIWIIFLTISIFVFDNQTASKWFLAFIVFSLLPLRLIFQRCVDHATAEINSIIDNKKAKDYVKKKFDAL